MSYSQQFLLAKNASRKVAQLSSKEKNTLLSKMAAALEENTDKILKENERDISFSREEVMIDRLLLTEKRIFSIAEEVRMVQSLEDPIGKILDETVRPNGLKISRVRVPFGVIGMIYESRPNVTVDAATLALKSGNAVVLKGGKEAIHTNRILVNILRNTLHPFGLEDAIQFLDTSGRGALLELLKAKKYIDILIPRGGRSLIEFVNENSTIPAIETGASVVHTYIDNEVDIDEALSIVVNEKVRRVSVCNALDTLLLHTDIAKKFLIKLTQEFQKKHNDGEIPMIEIHADKGAYSLLSTKKYPLLFPARNEDFATEWLDYKLNIKIVKNIDEALQHIQEYSLGHSESICTTNTQNAERFLKEIDAACVYHNASTCFSDGAQFGLGSEIGISTQKMHARGPFALDALTTYKWLIRGEGHTRK